MTELEAGGLILVALVIMVIIFVAFGNGSDNGGVH